MIEKVLKSATILKQTNKAYLVKYMGREIWLPISIVKSIYRNLERGTSDFIIPVWFAQKNGFSQL